jgi:hypothetical protein
MKFPRLAFPVLRDGLSLALVFGCGLAAGRAAETEAKASARPVEVGVRSSVDEGWKGMQKKGAIEHGKVYLIASLKEAPSEQKLVQPVDEAGLLAQLRRTINAYGFREAAAGDTPDVVLTVLYGRGHLRNPYLANIDGDVSSDSLAPTPLESLHAASVNPRLYEKRQWGAYEHKMMQAQKEKLFIRVTAWKFPGERKEKPAELWKTTMVVDDPDQRDLNQLYPEMLAAGVRFFDQPMKVEEVIVTKEGTVKLAPLIFLESDETAERETKKNPR